jgi:IS30 family transposase
MEKKKKSTRRPLTLCDRVTMYEMSSQGKKLREISDVTGRNEGVISRELRRNAPPSCYRRQWKKLCSVSRARYAHEIAQQRLKERKRGKRKVMDFLSPTGARILELVRDEGLSPWQASVRLKHDGIAVSERTIYRLFKRAGRKYCSYLPHKGKPPRSRIDKLRRASESKKRHISTRPVEAEQRSERGHLEMDTIVSRRGTSGGVVSLVDRYTRKKQFLFVEDLQAATIRRVVVRYLHTLAPAQRKTITTDNGTEFAQWEQLEKVFPGLKVYFCTPYASWEKGSIERANKDFRRFCPKGSDLNEYSNQLELDLITQYINRFPMKIFDGLSPEEFEEREAVRTRHFEQESGLHLSSTSYH